MSKQSLIFALGSLFVIILMMSKLYAFPSGNSAWVYGKNTGWIDQVSVFNSQVNLKCRLNYLFPETAIIHVDQKKNQLVFNYDPSVTLFYKSKLHNVKILPDFSFWVAHTNFMQWSEKEYQSAAKMIADKINQDPNADGVFLDLENYKPVLLPFYKTLASSLRKNHKIISVIVRPGQEDLAWFNALGDNAFVVLYGYDLHQSNDGTYPVSPSIYKERLKSAYIHFVKVSNASHIPVMGGVPAIATSYEWEKKIITLNKSTQVLESHYLQMDYLKAALEVYHSGLQPERNMGYSIWAFVDGKDLSRIHELPYQISEARWNLLKHCKK